MSPDAADTSVCATGVWQSSDAQRPLGDFGRFEKAGARPWVVGQAFFDFFPAICPHDNERLGRDLERPGQHHESFPRQIVHERGMAVPIRLSFERR